MKKNKTSKIISRIFGIISIFISIYVCFNTQKNLGYENYYIIPLIFGLLQIFFPRLNYSNIDNTGPLILAYCMEVKYSISPLISCLGKYGSWLGNNPLSVNINKAIWITLCELIIIYIMVIVCSKRQEKIYENDKPIIKPMGKNVIHLAIIIIGFLLFVLFPSNFIDYRWVFNTTNLSKNIVVDAAGSGVFKTLFLFARYSLVLVLINYFYKRNLKKENRLNLIFSLIVVLINCLYISNLSRMNIVSNLIIGLSVIVLIFDSKNDKKIIIKLAVILGIFMVGFLSYQKFFGNGRGETSNINNITWWGDTLNMYFTGIKETAVGIKAYPTVKSIYEKNRISLLVNDLMSNVSVLSHFSDSSKGSLLIFNKVYFGSTIAICQIPPNIVEGLYYFGYFAPIWPAFFVLLSYYFSCKAYKSEEVDMKYVYINASLWSGLVLMINSSMIFAFIINISLFYGIVSKLNKKIILKY